MQESDRLFLSYDTVGNARDKLHGTVLGCSPRGGMSVCGCGQITPSWVPLEQLHLVHRTHSPGWISTHDQGGGLEAPVQIQLGLFENGPRVQGGKESSSLCQGELGPRTRLGSG